MIDGAVVTELGVKVNPDVQQILVDMQPILLERKQYLLLNKPQGVLCTNSDPGGRTRVIDLFQEIPVRLFTVGRLDENSEGLLLVTNDGELAEQMAHPRYRVPRTYRVLVAGNPSDEALSQLEQGFYFTEGRFRVESAVRVRQHGEASIVEVRLRQGHNREVRRLFARIGHKVMRLKRVAFGPLKLGTLEVGEYRRLTDRELDRLREYLATPAAQRDQLEAVPPRLPSKPRRAPTKPTRPSGRPLAAPTDSVDGAGGSRRAMKSEFSSRRPEPEKDVGIDRKRLAAKQAAAKKREGGGDAEATAGGGERGSRRPGGPRPDSRKPGGKGVGRAEAGRAGQPRSGQSSGGSRPSTGKRPQRPGSASGHKKPPRRPGSSRAS